MAADSMEKTTVEQAELAVFRRPGGRIGGAGASEGASIGGREGE